MQTVRRFLVLTPVAFAVTTVAYLIYFAAIGGTGSFGSEVGNALRVALMGAVIVLAAVLVAVGLLRLLRVSNAWAALGLAFGLVVVVLGISYASIEEDGWGLLGLVVVASAQVPSWLTFAAGLLVGDLRNQAARNAVSPSA
ncbi:hypothetical protein [Promicromonospora sp. NPDC050249]|uniref:hypothetical protein n=1 Tax=Promicromonospora sp. NPDC050249 TaxID=3154743 RepID=UPI00340359CB